MSNTNTMLIAKETNMFNPEINLLGDSYNLNDSVLATPLGQFNYSATISNVNEKIKKIKVILSTDNKTVIEDEWDTVGNRSHTYPLNYTGQNVIKAAFNINKAYQRLKINYKCYDENNNIINDDNLFSTNGHLLQ